MRPIGTQVRALLAASEALQRPASASELANHAGINMPLTLFTRVCRRAERYGLMDVADVPGSLTIQFIARPGWREAVESPKAFKNPRIKATPRPRKEPARMINSVWQLGQGAA